MAKPLSGKLTLLPPVILSLCAIHGVGLAQSAGQSARVGAKTIVIDLNLLDVRSDVAASLEKSVKDASSVERLVAEGRAKPIVSLKMRSRPGEQASARFGQRIPVRTATPLQGTPQIQYENTGVSVDASPEIVGDQIQIKLKLDITYVARYQAAPESLAFLQRTLSDVVVVRPGESAVLLSAVQHETLWPGLGPLSSSSAGAPGAPAQPTGNFAAIITTRILE